MGERERGSEEQRTLKLKAQEREGEGEEEEEEGARWRWWWWGNIMRAGEGGFDVIIFFTIVSFDDQ